MGSASLAIREGSGRYLLHPGYPVRLIRGLDNLDRLDPDAERSAGAAERLTSEAPHRCGIVRLEVIGGDERRSRDEHRGGWKGEDLRARAVEGDEGE